MRGLASFAMGGRFRALALAMASAGSLLFAWLAAALVALVTLRKGYAEGFWLLLWAALPAIVVAQITGDSSALALIVGTAALGAALRGTVSLALTALLSSAVAVVTGLGLLAFSEPMLEELSRLFGEFFASLERQAVEAGGEALGLQPPTYPQLAGMMGTANGALSFLCLTLARYWQAALYNPGGFGVEFRALQFPRVLVWVLGIIAFAIASLGLEWRSWGAALLLPLTIAGFALLHARAAYRGQGSFWMGGIYTAWLVFDAAKLALVGLVLVDAVMDFRSRWIPAGTAGKTEQPSEDPPSDDENESDDEPRDRDGP